MLIVTGAIVAKPEGLDALLDAARVHVAQSRTEPGCIAHHFHVDVENPCRIVFWERWDDLPALTTHFEQPGTVKLMEAVRAHSESTEPLEMFEASPVSL